MDHVVNWNTYFSYDDGIIRWKERPLVHFCNDRYWRTWNTKHAGKPTGADIGGYLITSVARRRTLVHRIIWEMHNGPIPIGMVIDHINGDGIDNRLDNLRICTPTQNRRNRRMNTNNKLQFKGVTRNKARFKANIDHDGVRYHLGTFDTPEIAHAAYCDAANRLHKEFAHP